MRRVGGECQEEGGGVKKWEGDLTFSDTALGGAPVHSVGSYEIWSSMSYLIEMVSSFRKPCSSFFTSLRFTNLR